MLRASVDGYGQLIFGLIPPLGRAILTTGGLLRSACHNPVTFSHASLQHDVYSRYQFPDPPRDGGYAENRPQDSAASPAVQLSAAVRGDPPRRRGPIRRLQQKRHGNACAAV